MKLPTKAACVRAMGDKPENWGGQCHQASAAIAPLIDEKAVVRRGYFIGETTPGAMFHHRPCQHSWIELPDGRVCDPTRFAFVGGPAWPLWIGDDEDYDIGGCKNAAPSGPPPNLLSSNEELTELNLGSVDYVADLLGTPPEFRGEDWLEISWEQAAWLGTLPIKDREGAGVLYRFYAAEVYEALIAGGHEATIPIDRRDWILGRS